MAVYSLYGDESGLPHTTIGNIPYEIQSVTYSEMFVSSGQGGGATTIVCRVKWEDKDNWRAAMLGFVNGSVTAPTGYPGILERAMPEANPLVQFPTIAIAQTDTFPPPEPPPPPPPVTPVQVPVAWNFTGVSIGAQLQYCSRIDQANQGANQSNESEGPGRYDALGEIQFGWPKPKWAIYRVQFDTPLWEMTDNMAAMGSGQGELDRYCIRRRRTIAKELQYGNGQFRIVADNPSDRHVLGNKQFKICGYADIQYEFYRWPSDQVNRALYEASFGKINNAEFDTSAPRGYSIPENQMCFVGYDDTQQIVDPVTNEPVCNPLTLFFRTAPAPGWNAALANDGTFKAISSDGTASGGKPYSAMDFMLLVQPG